MLQIHLASISASICLTLTLSPGLLPRTSSHGRFRCAIAEGPAGFCPCPDNTLPPLCAILGAEFNNAAFLRHTLPKAIHTDSLHISFYIKTNIVCPLCRAVAFRGPVVLD